MPKTALKTHICDSSSFAKALWCRKDQIKNNRKVLLLHKNSVRGRWVNTVNINHVFPPAVVSARSLSFVFTRLSHNQHNTVRKKFKQQNDWRNQDFSISTFYRGEWVQHACTRMWAMLLWKSLKHPYCTSWRVRLPRQEYKHKTKQNVHWHVLFTY